MAGLLDDYMQQQGGGGLLGGLLSSNGLLAAGAQLLGGGGWGGAAQGFLQGRQMDQRQALSDLSQRAVMSAVTQAGGNPAQAIAAAVNPEIAKLFFANRAFPEFKAQETRGAGFSFNPGTGEFKQQYNVAEPKTVPEGNSLVNVMPSVSGVPTMPAGTPSSGTLAAPQVQTIMQGGPKFDDVTKLRTEFQNQPGPKQFSDSAAVYSSMMKSAQADTAPSDLDMVYGLAKLLDPGSVVREGEFETVRKSQAIPDQIRGYWQFLTEGKGKLDQNARTAIMDIARNRLESYREQAGGDITRYRDLAVKNRFDPDQVVKPFAETPRYSPTRIRTYNPATGRIE